MNGFPKNAKKVLDGAARLLTRPPLERMLAIHRALQAGRYPNATSLAAELEVSPKSVQRDFGFMRLRMKLPLEYVPEKGGYHYTQEVTSFPTMEITEGELFALLVAEKALQQYRGTNFEAPLVNAFRKMAGGLPDAVSLNLSDLDKSISFRTSAEPILNLEIFDALAKATAQGRQLRLEYKKPGSQKAEERIVDPYHIANINGEWFLFAHCHLRNDIRTFVPARIRSAQPTGRRFTRPPKFSLDKRLRDSFGVHSAQGEFDVVIRFDEIVADYIREKKWHASQQLRNLKNGGVEISLKLSSLVEIQRWVLGWGGNAVVISPPELTESVQAAARAILGQPAAEKPQRPRR